MMRVISGFPYLNSLSLKLKNSFYWPKRLREDYPAQPGSRYLFAPRGCLASAKSGPLEVKG